MKIIIPFLLPYCCSSIAMILMIEGQSSRSEPLPFKQRLALLQSATVIRIR